MVDRKGGERDAASATMGLTGFSPLTCAAFRFRLGDVENDFDVAHSAVNRPSAFEGSLPWEPGASSSEVRFALDETLEGLARRLRLCGINAASTRHGCPAGKDVQQWLLEECQQGPGCVILTADRALARRLAGYPIYLVATQGKENQLCEISSVFNFKVDIGGLMSRCSKCNGEFSLLSKEEAAAAVEVFARFPDREYWRCDGCGHHVWQGGQYERGIATIQKIVETMSLSHLG